MALDQTACTNLSMDAIVARLEFKLKIQADDDAKVGLVRSGKLQDDPQAKKFNVLIHPGGEDWPDEINTKGQGAGKWVENAYAIGGPYGSAFWRRRFVVQFEIFFVSEASRDSARTKALLVMARAHNAIATWDVGIAIPTDSFGEKPYDSQIVKTALYEGGGDGDYNWRGHMHLEVLTEIEPFETD